MRGSRRARDKIIERFGGLPSSIVCRLPPGTNQKELLQEASLGLIEAVDRFDYGRNVRFSTYASAVIWGKLKTVFERRRLVRSAGRGC